MRVTCCFPTLFVLLLGMAFDATADEWPQWRGPGRDGRWHETGIVERFDSDRLTLEWKVPVSGGYTGPTVAVDRVFLTDRVDEPESIERILCFDWKTGKRLWTHTYGCKYDIGYRDGPRASVTIDRGRAFALGAVGHLHCLDARSGRLLWRRDMRNDYNVKMPTWGIAAAPLVFEKLLIVQIGGADGACVVALEAATGREVWRAVKDRASYSAPVVVEQAGRPVLIVWTGDNVVGLAPESGEVFWKYPFPPAKWVLGIHAPVVDGDRLFVSTMVDGALMLRLHQDRPAVSKTWRRKGRTDRDTDALHVMIGSPHVEGDYLYGVDSYGQLRCLDAATGDRVWEDLTVAPATRWSTVHTVRNGRRVWMFNELGELIIGELSPTGFDEISRAKLIEPTRGQLPRGKGVCWSHPAYAYKHIFARNDDHLVCASLAAEQ